MKRIFLIGMMGTGKSTVGEILSKELNRSFIDIDSYIENNLNKTIKEIFQNDGEIYFRKLESKTLVESKADIISCGGGILLNEKNRDFLKSNGFIIHLISSIENIIKRIGNTSSRPLLNNKNLKNVLNQIKEKRFNLYKKVANISIDTNNINASHVCSQIIKEIKND